MDFGLQIANLILERIGALCNTVLAIGRSSFAINRPLLLQAISP